MSLQQSIAGCRLWTGGRAAPISNTTPSRSSSQAATGKPDRSSAPGDHQIGAGCARFPNRFSRARATCGWPCGGVGPTSTSTASAHCPSALALLHGLLDGFWDHVHPLPDADESRRPRSPVRDRQSRQARQPARRRSQSRLSRDGRLTALRVRDVEVALSKLPPRADEPPRTQGEIAAFLVEAADLAAALRAQTDAALCVRSITSMP